MLTPTTQNTEQLINGIANDGYAIIKNFLPPEQIETLASEAKMLQEIGAMRRAGTGKNAVTQPDDSLRGDFILWLAEDNISAVQQEYRQHMENLREHLNGNFYIGLFDLESHFAIYPPGAIYRKHLDQFQGFTQRQVSCTLYLNQDWQLADGGQLRLYLDGISPEPCVDIAPIGGTLVAFLSGRFWHEVLPAKHERISLTGWFRTRSNEVI